MFHIDIIGQANDIIAINVIIAPPRLSGRPDSRTDGLINGRLVLKGGGRRSIQANPSIGFVANLRVSGLSAQHQAGSPNSGRH